MICEKCKFCKMIDKSNESDPYNIVYYCDYGLGDSYNDGYCDYPFIFIPFVIVFIKIKIFIIKIIKGKGR